MNTYKIESAQTGNYFGSYQANTEAEALEAFAKAYGYASYKVCPFNVHVYAA